MRLCGIHITRCVASAFTPLSVQKKGIANIVTWAWCEWWRDELKVACLCQQLKGHFEVALNKHSSQSCSLRNIFVAFLLRSFRKSKLWTLNFHPRLCWLSPWFSRFSWQVTDVTVLRTSQENSEGWGFSRNPSIDELTDDWCRLKLYYGWATAQNLMSRWLSRIIENNLSAVQLKMIVYDKSDE